jgi:hypothetical protein
MEIDNLEDYDVYGKIVFKLIFEKLDGGGSGLN